MNLEILSNTVLEGRENKTNHFEMKLLHPINALNKPVFLEVLEVSYPATTKNIGKSDCWFILQIYYENLKKTNLEVLNKIKYILKVAKLSYPKVFII